MATRKVTYNYFDEDDHRRIQLWLRSRPDGIWRVLIGTMRPRGPLQTEIDLASLLLALTVDEGRGVMQWLAEKMEKNEFMLRLCHKTDRVPAGVGIVAEEEC